MRAEATGRGVDFITIDGGEGGTGAAPLVFADHVSLPFRWGSAAVYRTFAERDLADDVVFVGSGPTRSARDGADGHGTRLRRAQRRPRGDARHRVHPVAAVPHRSVPDRGGHAVPWRQRGLDPADKSVRCANYLAALRFELLRLARACGQPHPALVTVDDIEVLEDRFRAVPLGSLFDYGPGWGLPAPVDQQEIRRIMAGDDDPAGG